MKHAKAGGEIGTNGEFYEGGKFMPSTTLPKQEAAKRKAASKKQEIALYTWEVAPEVGMWSIWPRAVVYAMPIREGRTIVRLEPYMPAFSKLDPELQQRYAALMERWNNGERWYWPE